MGKQGRCDVAEVATWHTQYQFILQSLPFHLRISVEVIERLWKKTGHVYGVGRSEKQLFVQFFIHESTLYQGLTIIESAIHFDSGYVLSQGSKLTLLYLTYFPFGV